MDDHPKDPDSGELAPTASAAPPPDGPAREIGLYRMLHKLGEGGMGEVWLAEQTEPVKRRVALKVIKQGMDTKQVVARFEAERQALAMMDHPAVAKVFDAGATPEGRPYFAMEYVKGVPITAHCDTHKLNNSERLQLFMEVCEGVQHAHQKAIIHRDLKPSNVLVSIQDGKAAPKIIDFGVAKATAQKLTEKTMFTQLGVLIGTPEYMSPEQAELTGQDIDTRTDVYSLGVMLYELLVGALPFDPTTFRAEGFDAIRKKIREQDPPRPSTRLSTLGDRSTESARLRQVDLPTLRRQLQGDLDWITMKALEKDRTRRYASPSEFAADVGRHLKHEPVLASPPSAAYRARKFMRRHRFGVLAAVLVMAAMGLGLAGTTLGFLRAVEASEDARRETEVANQVSAFLEDLIRGATPSVARGEEVTVREVLDHGAERIDRELEDQPLVHARLMNSMGGAYKSLGMYDEAAQLVERALRIRRDVLGNEHPHTLASMSSLGEIYRFNARPAESRALKKEVYETWRRLRGLEHPTTLGAMKSLASSYIGGPESKEAETLLMEMLPVARRVLGDDHFATLSGMSSLGLQYQNTRRYDEAESLFREVYETRRRTLGPDHPNTLNSLWNLGSLYTKIGRYEEADPIAIKLLETRRRVMGPAHHSTIVAMNLLADVRRRQGKSDEAAKLLTEALDLCDTEGRAEIQCRADKEYRLGKLYLDVGDYERTADHLERSFEHYKSLGWYHPSAPTVGSELAYELVRLGRFDEAEKARREVLEIQRDHLGENHPGTLKAMNDLGVFYYRRGRHQEAEPLYLKAIETSGRVLDGDDPVLANFMYNLGELYSVQGRWDEARPLVVGALEIRRRVLGDDHPDTARSKEHAAILKAVDGRHDEAEAMLLEALEALGREEGDRSGDTARLSYNLACLEASRDQPERAMDWLSRSVDAGWADADEMIRDAWLESLHGPEFDALVEHVRRNAAGREADSPQ